MFLMREILQAFKDVSDERNLYPGGRDVCDARDLIVITEKMFVMLEI